MNVVVTGSLGFIGSHLIHKLLKQKKFKKIYGIDLENKKNKKLKNLRKQLLIEEKKFNYINLDVSDLNKLYKFFKKQKIDILIHLAAEAGVRDSVKNPGIYFKNNMIGFFNILEISKIFKIKHLMFASSSSVYGNKKKNLSIKENSNSDNPLSFYGATKKSNEVMAYSYSNVYGIPMTALRFFTVYGPLGRPDMAIFKFTKNNLEKKTIYAFDPNKNFRDYTYINDVVEALEKLIFKIPKSKIPFRILNIGTNKPVNVNTLIKIIEKETKIKSKINVKKMHNLDVNYTNANLSSLKKLIKLNKKTHLKDGIKEFINWYIEYIY